MNSKKLVSAALTVATVLALAGTAVLPSVAGAQTTSSLQAQIAALLAQIQTLQSQLGTSGTASTGATYNFTSDLTVGSTGAQVTALQQFLIAQGDLVLATPTTYFGALTQKALAKFQAANGISPAVGYFGPKTRAFVNSMSSGTTPVPPNGTSTPVTTAPATGLQIGLASDNPAVGTLVSSAQGSAGGSAARIPVLAFNLTAGNSGAATVSQLVFQKTGVVSDSAISNAYLVQNGQVVAQYASLSSGVLTFNGLNLSIPAGQTEEFQLAVGLSSGSANAGNTVAFALMSASSVSAFDVNNNAITAVGSFPMNGSSFTVTTVSNPPLATLTNTSSSIGTQVTAGTQGNIVGSWNFNVGINPVYLQNLNFHVIGSANDSNIQNVKLMVNGVQFGQTLSAVPANGMADFNVPAGSVKLNSGGNNVQVVADVMGSPNMYFQFEILNSYDVLAVDSQYNVPIAVTNTGGVGTAVNITPGAITVSQNANTPTGNISKGMSNVALAKFDIYASGEPVKVQWLDFNIQLGGVSASVNSISNEIQSVSLTDDAGNQIGTTITTPPSGNTCQMGNGGTTSGVSNYSTSTGNYYDCFGTPSSPINYIVPANTTRVLTLKANIQSTADFSTITGNLTGNSSNLQGQVSSKTVSSGAANGVTLTLVSSSLGATENSALGNQSVSAGTTNLRIGSYSLSASSAEGVNVNTVSILLTPTYPSWISGLTAFQNLKLIVNGVQFGQTNNTLSPQGTYVFSGSPINVPAGQTVNVDVYADTLSSATGTYNNATELTGYTGTGVVSYDSITPAGNVLGQSISFSGHPAIVVAADSSNPASTVIPQTTPGNTLAVFRFTETSNVESVKVSQLNVTEAVSSSSPNFSNVQLFNGSQLLGTAIGASSTGVNSYVYVFNSLQNPLVVPMGGSVSVTLKGDVGTFSGNSFVDNSTSTFSLATSSIVARGNTSNKPAAVSGSASGNAMTVLRSIETLAATPVTGTPPAGFQQLGSITLTSNLAGDTIPASLKLTFNSTATSSFLATVVLKDQSNNQLVPTASTTGANPTVTFTIPNSYDVTANQSYTFTVWGNLSNIPAISQTTQSLSAQIVANTDYTYLDGATNGSTVNLPVTAVPITVINLLSTNGGPF